MRPTRATPRGEVLTLDTAAHAVGRPRHAPVTADPTKAHVPQQHPLRFWKVEEAAKNAGMSENALTQSDCPRIKIGRSLLFDPIETVAWVRLHLTHVVSSEAAR